MSETTSRTGLRDITRDAVRSRIAAVAVARFDAEGFDSVTVEQIAAEVGISARSFHRYFPAKEDAVIGDPARHRDDLADALRARPAGEPVWDALREAFVVMLERGGADSDAGRQSVRVMLRTPSLRARNLEKHLSWAEVLVPLTAERIARDDADLRARTLVHAALSCFDVAISIWAVEDTPGVLPVDLLRRTFDTLDASS
ncbi:MULTISPECIES: TetR family transcriptional regulator [unclassified Curtobacterium]|uniref:acyl-CoA-like ligand-binding transcription factor n=1 Tax=unclassified Curtobacterium TaxID=257496 RepID=UPI000DA912DD|nr:MULTISPECIES: TetR family transcriptional regulator [unclassified Curtobacterium]PZE25373.1 TetR family transcriptional regulator [Curtobacterium sp. MCBD17_028]PZE75399.1 TetR family transcriptional regulator [Curtobacterium sp. MCBD17_019]PZF58011.1 TetR family transcriptional regulator [Curtobacterium sp. MCBD17_034]PZM33202.1 TetR family transcriptional regulator [Curtobacterium sp. MCBD17_031]WIB62900.1 TetR family transcriptional regulator [Curtobacterium sp. MCBD17_040]